MSTTREKYGLKWPTTIDDLEIEMWFVKRQGNHVDPKTHKKHGLGLSHHLKMMRQIIWPELDSEDNGQRWHKVCRDTVAANKVTVFMGPGSSGKTHEASWICLCMWLANPKETFVGVSSTDMRGLRLRVWGEITSLWQKAIERFDYLPGHMIDSKLAITAESIGDADDDDSDRKVRDFREAIVGIPTVQNGKQVGLGKWVGIKQKNVILIADEAQFMGPSFLSAFSNLNKNENFKAIVLGNPMDIMDPLGKAAEPIDGWTDHMEPEKTSVWKTRFMNGACVNLIGTDSPNFDFPPDKPTRFKYLISKEKIADTLSFFPKDSFEYYSQCIGCMKIGTMARRVVTRKMCEQFGALNSDVIWEGTPRTRIYAVDAAYGGDRCVGGKIEFGQIMGGKIVMMIHRPSIIPIVPNAGEPEDQIAAWIKRECTESGIPAENVYHDATGRGSLGTAIARLWSPMTNPVEFGGTPSERPVSLDMFIYDPKTRMRRLKLCREHYDRFVTELWFSVRYAIEASQVRGLPEDVMEEGCMRQWDLTTNSRVKIETKEDMKERVGRSPDLFDWLAVAVEGARRRGFQINKLANESENPKRSDALRELMEKQRELIKSKQLSHA